MSVQVVVLNGGSSSGKYGIARCLKAIQPTPWISLGVDDLLDTLPPSLTDVDAGVTFGQQGQLTLGQGFRELEAAWLTGIAAMARADARIIVDDVFLGGATSQERVRQHLDGLEVLWVGVAATPPSRPAASWLVAAG